MDLENSEDSYTAKEKIKPKEGTKLYKAILPTVGVEFNDDSRAISFKNNEIFKVNLIIF